MDLSGIDIHTVAAVFKSFLRQLPSPVVPRNPFFGRFMAASGLQDEKLRVDYYAALVSSLPKENRALLQYICSFFSEVCLHSSGNKMNADNLAIVFSPSLFGTLKTEDELSLAFGNSKALDKVLKESKIASDICLSLISQYESIFLRPIKQPVKAFRLLQNYACPERHLSQGEIIIVFKWDETKHICYFELDRLVGTLPIRLLLDHLFVEEVTLTHLKQLLRGKIRSFVQQQQNDVQFVQQQLLLDQMTASSPPLSSPVKDDDPLLLRKKKKKNQSHRLSLDPSRLFPVIRKESAIGASSPDLISNGKQKAFPPISTPPRPKTVDVESVEVCTTPDSPLSPPPPHSSSMARTSGPTSSSLSEFSEKEQQSQSQSVSPVRSRKTFSQPSSSRIVVPVTKKKNEEF